MFGWIVVAIPGIPIAVLAVKGLISEVAFWIWMGQHDVGVTHHKPLVAAERPTRAEVAGFTGMVVEGELV